MYHIQRVDVKPLNSRMYVSYSQDFEYCPFTAFRGLVVSIRIILYSIGKPSLFCLAIWRSDPVIYMKIKLTNRQLLSVAIIVFYLLPLLLFSGYTVHLLSPHKSWQLLSFGLFFAAFGTISLIFLIGCWERAMKEKRQSLPFLLSQHIPLNEASTDKDVKVTLFEPSYAYAVPHETSDHEKKEPNLLEEALQSSQKKQEEMAKIVELKEAALEKQIEEIKELQLSAQQIMQEFSDYKVFSEEQLKQKQLQFVNLQKVTEEQRAEMDKRQDQIHQLDTKVHDLSYEIKTLLYLHEEETNQVKEGKAGLDKGKESNIHKEPFFHHFDEEGGNDEQQVVCKHTDAAWLMKKCIGTAQKLTGANYYSNESSRFRDYASSSFAIDQRRLFDSLRSETGAIVLVYSLKDQKLLFVNGEAKTMLGWSPDKFLTDFGAIMQEGLPEWKKAINSLGAGDAEVQVRVLAKTKQGQEILLNCQLGIVPSGLFKNYVVGILYPA